MLSPRALFSGLVHRWLPTPFLDDRDMDRPVRLGRYGEQTTMNIVPTKHVLCEEGSYFVATNPTIGTGIAPNAVETAYADTRGFFVIFNGEIDPGTGRTIYLDYLRLIMTVAPTATVGLHFAVRLDVGNRVPTTAANRTLLAPTNVNMASGRTSIAQAYSYANAGAMTIPASTANARTVARICLPTSLGIANDEYIVKFGGEDISGVPGLTAVRAAAPARIMAQCAPCAIGPGQSLVIHRWWLTEATNAPTFEFELGWWER